MQVPARSNDFQELITLLTQVLGAEAATPSQMLTDTVTGEPREVDICVTGKVAGHEVLIGIECRAWKTPQSVTWVEEMYGKHSHLPTSKLVLVSKSGFTKAALKFAEFHGIKAITPAEVTPGFVGEVVNNLTSVWAKRFDFTPEKLTLIFDPPITYEDGYVADRTEAFGALQIYRANGIAFCTAADYVHQRMQNVNLNQDSFRDATGVETHFTSVDEGIDVGGEPLYIVSRENDQPPDTHHRITRAEITGKLRAFVTEVALTHGEYDGTPYSTGVEVLGDQTFHWVVTEGNEGPRVGSRVLPVGKTTGGKSHVGVLGEQSHGPVDG